jgi:hypothetical protein
VALHVHLIENDWLAGQQRWVATVSFVVGAYVLEDCLDPTKWTKVLQLEPLPSRVRPEDEEPLLSAIARRFQGDYLFCTEPHDAVECDYPKVTSLQSPQAPVHKIKRPPVTPVKPATAVAKA